MSKAFTKEECQWAKEEIEKYGSIRKAAKANNVSFGYMQKRQKRLEGIQYGHKGKKEIVPFSVKENIIEEEVKVDDTKKMINKTPKGKEKFFYISAVQNNVKMNNDLFDILNQCVKYRRSQGKDVEIILSSITYRAHRGAAQKRNSKNKKEEDKWDERAEPYIIDNPVKLAKNLIMAGNFNISVSTQYPLNSKAVAQIHGKASVIFPHSKLALKSIPNGNFNEGTKILYTSQILTNPKYSDTRAGLSAEVHHSLGMIEVRVDKNGQYHCTPIQYSKYHKNVFLIDKNDGLVEVHAKGYNRGHRAEAVHFGDTHFYYMSKKRFNKLFKDKDSLLSITKAKKVLIHDGLDSHSVNHHEKKNRMRMFQKEFDGSNDYKKEIEQFFNCLDEINKNTDEVIVVDSNHDRQVLQFINDKNYADDTTNAHLHHRLNMAYMEAFYNKEITDISQFNFFEYLYKKMGGKNKITFLDLGQSYLIKGIECGAHGDKGIAGARGNISSFTLAARPHNIGHSHAAGIINEVFQAGVSADKPMPYSFGSLNAWSCSHILILPNGKRTILFLYGEDFC